MKLSSHTATPAEPAQFLQVASIQDVNGHIGVISDVKAALSLVGREVHGDCRSDDIGVVAHELLGNKTAFPGHAGCIGARLAQRGIILVEDLNAVIVPVVHENVPRCRVHGHAMYVAEVTGARVDRAARRSTELAPVHEELSVLVELRDARSRVPIGDEEGDGADGRPELPQVERPLPLLAQSPGEIDPQGVKGSALTAEQKNMLLDLIGEWVNIVPDGAAAARMAEIKSKLDDTYFAWLGPMKNGSAVYFRVQGPTVVIEYAPQGSTDHIHTVIRDPTNDYGQKLLKR